MRYEKKITSSDFAGIYKDIADIIGVEATMSLHDYLKGQQITFPKKLFNKDYISRQVVESASSNVNIRTIAAEYGYTERRLRQILRESAQSKIT